jgi:hypothetical protein
MLRAHDKSECDGAAEQSKSSGNPSIDVVFRFGGKGGAKK